MVESAVEEVSSADAFYAALRDSPFYVTRDVARNVWAEYGRQTGWESYRLRRDPDAALLSRFFDYDDYGISYPYMAKIRLTGIDPETGVEWIKRPTLFYDHIPTQAELDQDAQAAIDTYTPVGMDPLVTTARVVGLHADTEAIKHW